MKHNLEHKAFSARSRRAFRHAATLSFALMTCAFAQQTTQRGAAASSATGALQHGSVTTLQKAPIVAPHTVYDTGRDAMTTTNAMPTTIKPPATTLKPPPINDVQKATLVAPSVLGNAITGLGDTARGIVAGESLVIQGRGFGASAGRVDIAVQTSASSQQDLSFRVSHWSDTEIRGSVGASLGYGDSKAAITIYPAGKSVSDHISSGHAGQGATRNPWRFNFMATRADQTIPASSAQSGHLLANLSEPAAREIKQSGQLLNGIAYSRIHSAADPTGLGCRMATPQDRFKLKLATGFELKSVSGRDLNASKRYGLTDIGKCDIRSTVPAPSFVQATRDGSFTVGSTWDVVNRLGAKATKKSGANCSESRYLGVTKTPLGFDWDNTGTDRCAANAEYVIDAFVVRGPAGANPLLGSANHGAAAR
jgi:hypothetical protein